MKTGDDTDVFDTYLSTKTTDRTVLGPGDSTELSHTSPPNERGGDVAMAAIVPVKKVSRPFFQLGDSSSAIQTAVLDRSEGAPSSQSTHSHVFCGSSTGCRMKIPAAARRHLTCAGAFLLCFFLGLQIGLQVNPDGPASLISQTQQFRGATNMSVHTSNSSARNHSLMDSAQNRSMVNSSPPSMASFYTPSSPPPLPAPRAPLPSHPPNVSPFPSSAMWLTTSQRGRGGEPFRFRRCAVVGSGRNLLGRGFGAAIDMNDVVVHVNNVPTAGLADDMGSRTDILFSTLCNLETRACEDWDDDDWCEIQQEIQHGGEVKCLLQDNGNCPFGAVFYRSRHRTSCDDNFGRVAKGSKRSQVGIAVSSDYISEMAFYLRRRGGPFCGIREDNCDDPSTGFHAILTMSLLCDEVELYGFQGTGTVDGHGIGHNVANEHNLTRHLVAHAMPAGSFPSIQLEDRWAMARVSYGDTEI